MTAPRPAGRLVAVDALRTLGVLAVLVIHAAPFTHGAAARLGTRWDAATVANQLARFAVPMFFVFAGYFWARRGEAPEVLAAGARHSVPRLLARFAVWSLVFLVPFESDRILRHPPAGFLRNLRASWTWTVGHPGTVLMQGTSGHLWFLMALALSVTVLAVLRRWASWRTVLVVGAGCLAAALLAGPYRRTAAGFTVPFNPRNGVGFSLFPVALGGWLAGRPVTPRWRWTGLALFAAGALLAAAELTWLRAHHRTSLAQDLVIGTLAMGVGAALMGLGDAPWLRAPRLAAVGPWVLGLYAAHPILVDLLTPVAVRLASPWADVAELTLVAAGTLGLVRLLGRRRATRWLVT